MMIVKSHGKAFASFCMLAIGTFSLTKVYFFGCLAIAEIFVFVIAPILFLRKYQQLRHDGVLPFVWMILLLFVSAVVSGFVNRTPFVYALHAYAVMYAHFCYYIVFYCLLKKNIKSLGWYFWGAAISGLITIYVLSPQIDLSSNGAVYMGQADLEDTLNGQLFWIQKVSSFVRLPIVGLYLQTPILYSAGVLLIYLVFIAMVTVSGRSAAIATLAGVGLILIGRKSRSRMKGIGRRFWIMVCLGIGLLVCFKIGYSHAASTGLLGNDARQKYEIQSRKGKDALSMLMISRSAFFIGAMAALDRPLIGYGPLAEDKGGYTLKFYSKFGDDQDFREYLRQRKLILMHGFREKLPTHSHIVGAWVHYGIYGLIYYGWIMWLLIQHLRKYCAAVPQWFGYFALMIPTYIWHLLFSPIGDRSLFGLLIATLFFARAVGEHRIALPNEIEREIRRHDR